ncbi:DUF1800 family protein [Duganella sp. BuS-21]|uniref:DUF1800 domain-containing protein n=1 Tax=Duganella sp. BuS-21 TaxID=2943848 RepID=UPI0035A66D49
MVLSNFKRFLPIAVLSILAACGGSVSDTTNPQEAQAPQSKFLAYMIAGASTDSGSGTLAAGTSSNSSAVAAATMTPEAAAHFLAQASFGPTSATIAELASMGTSAWITAQFSMPQNMHRSYLNYYASSASSGVTRKVVSEQFLGSFWQQAISGPDQLRQRVAFALSQIFVISTKDDAIYPEPYGVANYYDMLARRGLLNFRDLLEGVALHPLMGTYLSHIHNVKEDGTRMPDENFAREVMQLMTIGLYQLNQDGSVKLADGKPQLTYEHEDIMGLAKVFTGWSWAGPDQSESRFYGYTVYSDRAWTPMQNYTAYHSTSEKSFLGVTIPAGTNATTEVKIALDTLFNHPNVGPFIGRQLIQHLVTSNPSPAYVSRVAAAFNNNGSGVRGDMKAVIRAILLDSEATEATNPKKLREPLLRLANFLRAFNATSSNGWFLSWGTSDVNTALAQTVLQSPSVFNFYRPMYSPPGSALSNAGQVSAELQITSGPSITGYLNFLQQVMQYGFGVDDNIRADYTKEWALAATPELLVDRVNLLLMSGSMSSTLRAKILAALNSVVLDPKPWNGADTIIATKNRVYLAIYLTMASPEYLVQK